MNGSRGRTQTLIAMVAAAGIVQLPTAAIVVALPTIHAQFDTSLAELQWTVTAFYIPFSALLIAAGRLADVFGRRRMLLTGCGLFAIGSSIAAAAPDAQLLIAGIALSGIGGALLMPASTSLKLSAALVAVGIALAVALLRKSRPVDAEPIDELAPSVTPRPAPRRAAAVA